MSDKRHQLEKKLYEIAKPKTRSHDKGSSVKTITNKTSDNSAGILNNTTKVHIPGLTSAQIYRDISLMKKGLTKKNTDRFQDELKQAFF